MSFTNIFYALNKLMKKIVFRSPNDKTLSPKIKVVHANQ